MKKLFSFFILIQFISDVQAQNVGIGTVPNASAKLDVNSTTQGFLPPRMRKAQRNAIVNPAAGLMIWCINCGMNGEMQVFNGYTWMNISGVVTPPVDTTICIQEWMIKNLDVSNYRDGTPIPKVTDPAVWMSLTTGAYCYYNNDSATYAAVYGKLYNWYAVNDPRGLAPIGWHIPTTTEFTELATCLGGAITAGAGMKEAGTIHWQSPNTGATNSSGFTGLPGGLRYPGDGSFGSIGNYGFWWTSTEDDVTTASARNLNYNNVILNSSGSIKQAGYSVRCLRD